MSVKKKIVLLDGGTGSSLVAVGHSEIETHPLWSALLLRTNPQAIIDCHKKFYEAGSDIVISATYQASFEGYCKTFNMTEAEAADLITEGVRLACRARNESQESTNHSGWVAGGVGPYGAILGDRSEYHGKYADSMSSQELISWHTKRLAAILKGQPDLLAIETIPIVKEAEAIIESLKMFPAARAWISFQCKDGKSTGHGEMFIDAIRRSIQSDQIIAVGANCCSPENVVPLLQSISHLTLPVPILMKPNNISYISQEQCKTPLAEMASDWLDLGATWLGGCCHFGPRDISCLRQFLETRSDVILHSFSGV